MAKCTKCGADLIEGAAFCGNCGATVETQQPEDNQNQPQDLSKIAMEKGKDLADKGKEYADKGIELAGKGLDAVENNKYVQELNDKLEGKTGIKNTGLYAAIAGIAVVAVVVIVLLVSLFGGGYKKAATATIDLYNKRNTSDEKLYKAMYGKTYGEFKLETSMLEMKLWDEDFDEDDYKDDAVDQMEELYDNIEDEYGKNWKIKYKISSTKKLSNSALKDYKEEWEDTLDAMEEKVDELEDYEEYAEDNGYDEDVCEEYYNCYKKWYKKLKGKKVTAGYKVKLKDVEIKGKDDDDELGDNGKVTIEVVKIGGEWVVMKSDFSVYSLELD